MSEKRSKSSLAEWVSFADQISSVYSSLLKLSSIREPNIAEAIEILKQFEELIGVVTLGL